MYGYFTRSGEYRYQENEDPRGQPVPLADRAGDDGQPAAAGWPAHARGEHRHHPLGDARRVVLLRHRHVPVLPLVAERAQRRDEHLEDDVGGLGAARQRAVDVRPRPVAVARPQRVEVLLAERAEG